MLLLTRSQIAGLLTVPDYIRIVEDAFRSYAMGHAFEPALAHVDAADGEFHIKAGGLRGNPPYFGLKVNGGFFSNRARFGLPNIQGLIVLSRADNGVPLAVMDSMEITIQRTGAATAVAAKYLARPDSRVCTVCGSGNQARIQVRALKQVLPLEEILVWGPSPEKVRHFSETMSAELGMPVNAAVDLASALQRSDVCVTATPSKAAFIRREWVPDGMFIAAVGADSPDKQELDAGLVAASKLVADIRGQSSSVGESHHAIAAGLMNAGDIYAELGDIVTGRTRGRTSANEIIIFDSTGTALQDVAAAAAVYEIAMKAGIGAAWGPAD
jgi:ornithine cyclodeaminase/alanine dehydrogenase